MNEPQTLAFKEEYYDYSLEVSMDPELKKAWLDALRSDKYKQGTGALTEIRQEAVYHCCLGVLCELTPSLVSKGTRTLYPNIVRVAYNGNACWLPRAVVDVAKLDREDPVLPITGHSSPSVTLSSCNDDGMTFSQIADLIEYFF
jgi:hypothetical protein